MKSIESVELVRAWDRDTGASLVVNGEEIGSVNYEEHGSGGEDVLAEVGRRLAEMMGVTYREEELSDDAYRERFGRS